MNILKNINGAIGSFLDLIFPKFCVGCKKEGSYICPDCKSKLQINHFPFCSICKNKIPADQRCPHHKSAIRFCLSPFSYDNILIKDLVHDFKYAFMKSIGLELAEFQIETIKKSAFYDHIRNSPEKFLLVPVPLHRKRLAWRGFNQSEILAKKISEGLNIDIFHELKRIKNTLPQIDMPDKEQRQENIKNAFVCDKSKKLKGKTAILIDDMITTGSTLEECAKILKKSNAKEVWALTLAK